MELDGAGVIYKKHLKITKKLSTSMVSGTMREVDKLTEYLDGKGVSDTTGITADLIASFPEEKYTHLEKATYNNYIGYLSRYLKWMAEEDMLGADRAPWRKLVPHKRPERTRPRRFFTEEDIGILAEGGANWHSRDEYYIRCSYWMTRRKCEVCTIKVGDIDFTPRPDMPHGVYVFDDHKNKKFRIPIMIRDELHEILQQWFELYADLIGRPLEPDDYLFPPLKVGRAKCTGGVRMPLVMKPKTMLSTGSVNSIWHKAIKVANEKHRRFEGQGWNSHAARRGGATDLVDALREMGVEDAIRVAQYQLNHATERMTENYIDDTREAHSYAKAMQKLAAHRRGETTPVPEVEQQPSGVIDFSAFRSRRQVRGTA